jgi:REP element-mobilizing transposase RayT
MVEGDSIMARQARGEVIDPTQVQVLHCVQRCVRRAFLCGNDPYSGESYEHRREWIRERLEFLASIFGIDCLTYTVLSNHMHVVLRSRPDVVRRWSNRKVAEQWLRLFPKRRHKDGSPKSPTDAELRMITSNKKRLAELRLRLSDISWWMRCTAENIARQANRQDQCSGRFWEGRFKSQLILDEASLLACAAYVDLNPVRAALAENLEQSNYTGAKDRIDDLKQQRPKRRHPKRGHKSEDSRTREWERSRGRHRSGWLAPIEIDEHRDPSGPDCSGSGRRASDKGFLSSISLTRYLELLDWTGRQVRRDKAGSIPSSLRPILERLGLEPAAWCDLVRKFGRLFKRAAGSPASLAAEASRRGQSWMQGPGRCAFATPSG